MKWFDRWVVRHTTWIKPLDDLSLEELNKLQQEIGKELEKRYKVD